MGRFAALRCSVFLQHFSFLTLLDKNLFSLKYGRNGNILTANPFSINRPNT